MCKDRRKAFHGNSKQSIIGSRSKLAAGRCNRRDLYELDSYQRKAEEVEYVESCTAVVDSSPTLTSVPQGAETLPYLNREAKS